MIKSGPKCPALPYATSEIQYQKNLTEFLLSFQKVSRINFFSRMSEHDVIFYSQTLIGYQTITSFVFVGDCLKQSIQKIINLNDLTFIFDIFVMIQPG